jgi:hypothetical protein
MADPVTMAAVTAFLPEMIGAGTAAATGAALAEGTAAALSPLALEAGAGMVGAVSPLALEAGSAAFGPAAMELAGWTGGVASADKFGAMLDKMGPKLAGQMGEQMMGGDQQPMPQGGGPRMGGQQQQPQPVQMDYGGAAPRRQAGASAVLGIDDEELKRLLMNLRGY